MSHRELSVLAEGQAAGLHWVLRAGGTRVDFATFLETIHADGRRDSGGMAGPPLYPQSLMNVYTGGTDQGPRRVLARTDPQVTRVQLDVGDRSPLELAPVATLGDPALTFFAVLLPQDRGLVSATGINADGHPVQVVDLSAHERHWRHFLAQRQTPSP